LDRITGGEFGHGSQSERGTDLADMKELVEYWLEAYHWRKEETRLSEFAHFKAEVDGLGIHFV
jgi:hypothetical protein